MRQGRSLLGPEARPRAARRGFAALVAIVMAAGCSGSRSMTSADAAHARDVLKIALDAWKNGDAPSALKDGSPSIVVQDVDWLAGARLLDFHVGGDGKDVEASLHVPVKLTLQTRKRKAVTKSVSYIVSTSPYVAVYRGFR